MKGVGGMRGIEDPGRLFDESDSELERTLLGVARAEKCSPRARAKTLAALGITGSALTAAAVTAAAVTAAATPLSVAGKAAWVKVVLGLSALGAVAIAPPVYRAWQLRHANPPPTARTGVPAKMVATPVATPPTTPIALAPAANAAATDDAAALRPTVAALRATTGDAASLRHELTALDGARAAVAGGRARRALALLDAYARDFPDGRLALEAEILRIDALARTGQAGLARHRAEAFLQRHPRSVLAARARQYLEE
jgi:hypothetical protein